MTGSVETLYSPGRSCVWADRVMPQAGDRCSTSRRYRARLDELRGENRLVYGDRDFLREHEDAAPSVIGAEHVAPLDDEDERPDTVYVPSERVFQAGCGGDLGAAPDNQRGAGSMGDRQWRRGR